MAMRTVLTPILKSRPSRLLIIAVLLTTACIGVWYNTTHLREVAALQSLVSTESRDVELDAEIERQIVAFCSACHALPQPESFARNDWHDEVLQGYHFYAKSGRTDLVPPPPYLAISYFRSRAPEKVQIPEQSEASRPSRIVFRDDRSPLDMKAPVPPAVAHLKWLPEPQAKSGLLVQCDMRWGTVSFIDPASRQPVEVIRHRVNNPCHAEPCDLDHDGILDLVVADLGSFMPDDHDRGRVVWLKGEADGSWTASTLAENLGRIADVRPVDLDADGDQDLVVAEFGWHRTGGLWILRNPLHGKSSQERAEDKLASAEKNASLHFQRERIDTRPGTIHAPAADLDGDGIPEIVALLSQEFERVELYTCAKPGVTAPSPKSVEGKRTLVTENGTNTGETKEPLESEAQLWTSRTLWAAPDPAFGLSGLELVDLDQDGDLDVLFTNGDTFDSLTIKPSHGVQWLRNEGQLRFVYQRIADLSGAYRAAAADFDRDGDLDLIASVWVPGSSDGMSTRAALVLFENIGKVQFARHTLQSGSPCLATLEVGDFDRDGDQDFAVSSHISRFDLSRDGLVIWWNETPPLPAH